MLLKNIIVLKKENLHPYRFQKVQELKTEDFLIRRNFCKWMSWKIQRKSHFPVSILFTDEAIFNNCEITNIIFFLLLNLYFAIYAAGHLVNITNICKEYFWARKNPHVLRDDSCKMVHHRILPTQCKSVYLPNRLANCPVFASRLSGHKLKYRTLAQRNSGLNLRHNNNLKKKKK